MLKELLLRHIVVLPWYRHQQLAQKIRQATERAANLLKQREQQTGALPLRLRSTSKSCGKMLEVQEGSMV
jgi:hypothetical protein